ncbi:polysaccharide deacetylase family protein [Massilia sp. LXY-6]|uniref:polysaccharide deacetylase family protein n=1 Tax=Massilia sp. LXY-6 TaxID=3379823 RepID=UPI003EE2B6D4
MAAVFTCSTDDGHPSDMKMAELLCKHDLSGTFFIPIFNREGPPVLKKSELREIGELFEIGSHTHDHCYLNTVQEEEAERQINSGKAELEDLIGQSIDGFCYPGGKFSSQHLALVKAAGFLYARTTTNLSFDLGACPYQMPTTIQFYPHSRAVYMRNFVQAGHWDERIDGLLLALKTRDWLERIYSLFDYSCQQNKVFHIWAHSNEIDRLNAWGELDRFFAYVNGKLPMKNRLTNYQLACRALDGEN